MFAFHHPGDSIPFIALWLWWTYRPLRSHRCDSRNAALTMVVCRAWHNGAQPIFYRANPDQTCAEWEYKDSRPSLAKRRNIASILAGGNFAPLSSHQVSTAI